MPRQDGIEIHLGQCRPAVLNMCARHDRHSFQQRFGFPAAVSFDDADNDLAALRLFFTRGLQHGVGLSHAWAHAEENRQLAARRRRLLALHTRENPIRVGPGLVAHAINLLFCRNSCTLEAAPKADEHIVVISGAGQAKE